MSNERRNNAAEGRRAGFKFHGMTTEELRRRREENQVEIRKSKREDSLNKRRNLVELAPPTPVDSEETSSSRAFSTSTHVINYEYCFRILLRVDVWKNVRYGPRSLFR